jgi:hypothetical protein
LGRIRTIKPEFFKHSGLFDLERETSLPIRLAFAGLWTCCDREGRFKWRVRELKLDILPYDDCDFSRVLDALATRGFIVKYASSREDYAYIPSWHTHQIVNNKESASSLPEPPENKLPKSRVKHATGTRAARKGREGKGKEEGADAPAPLPEWLNAEIWAGWIEMRKRIPRAPFTDLAEKGILEDLSKLHAWGIDPNARLQKGIKSGWRGVLFSDDHPPDKPVKPQWTHPDGTPFLPGATNDPRTAN